MKNENGSIVIWLLIGMLLFAALGMAMMQGSRTSAVSLSKEEASTYAKMVISQGEELKGAVKRMTLRGCDNEDISFENDIDVNYVNINNPPDTCKVFNPSGGGLNFPVVSFNDGTQWVFTGNNRLNTPAGGANNERDLIAVLGGLDEQTCRSLNEILGINPPTYTLDEADHFTLNKFTGTFPPGSGPAVNAGAGFGTAFHGKQQGCLKSITASPPAQSTLPGVYYYVVSLITR